MKKKLILLSVLCLLMLKCFSQNNVKGIVVADDSLKTPIPFVAVVLGDVADSSKFLYSTITDMSGMYHFSGVEAGYYILVAQCLGYDKFSERINISGKDVEKNITMASSINELGEVEGWEGLWRNRSIRPRLPLLLPTVRRPRILSICLGLFLN